MFTMPKVHINDFLPDGVLAGYNNDGRVVVCIEFHPNYKYLMGSSEEQEEVTEWHVCDAHARRIAYTAAWGAMDYACKGNA